jgi:Ca2+/Na+ antiporter
MDTFDKIAFGFRRYFFSGLLILIGLILLVKAITIMQGTCLAQSKLFLYGGLSSLLLGLLTLYFLLVEKISKFFIIGISVVLLSAVILFSVLNYNSIHDQIVLEEQTEEAISLTKQGLLDIQTLQEAYDKKYKNFAISFDSLAFFAKNDSIPVLVEAKGDVPTRRMTIEEAKELGYRDPKEVISEEEAIKLKLIIRRYESVPVSDYLFSKEKTKKDNRKYDFDINKLDVIRTIDTSKKHFTLKYASIDSVTYGVEIAANPPYGPQKVIVGNECAYVALQDTLKLGSLVDRKMQTNWKKQ